MIAPQDSISGKRYLELGYEKARLQLTGNIKYDLVVSDELLKDIATLHESWAKDRQIWIAASTHEGEEELILQAHHLLLKNIQTYCYCWCLVILSVLILWRI